MNKIILIILSSLLVFNANAQLVVDGNVTDSVLANTMVGAGVTISNVTMDCNDGAFGLFNSANSNVGLTDGILLSTGRAVPLEDCMYQIQLGDVNFDDWACGQVEVYIDAVLYGTYMITPADFGWLSVNVPVPPGSTLTVNYTTTGGAGCDEADHELTIYDPNFTTLVQYNNWGGTPAPIPVGNLYTGVANCNPATQTGVQAFSAVGPNNDNLASYSYNTTYADPDLIILNPDALYDHCILEFDFVPLGNQVDFQYVFASEEYPDYVCGTVNDVFGFFISGPGIVGSPNIAVLPGTTTPVSINTVNGGIDAGGGNCPPGGLTNTAYYVSNGNGNDCWNTPPPAHCSDTTIVRYNGLTVPLTATSTVIPCQTYHLKMAIADGGDHVFDSGVFLAANSLSSNQIFLESNYSTTSGDSIIYEGCGETTLAFTRTDTAGSTTVNFTIGGTATNGGDYPLTADSIVFPPGQDTVYLTIPANVDGNVEPLESVTIQMIQTICAVIDTTEITFYISDLTPIVPTTNDVSIACGTDSVKIGVGYTGPVDSVIWNTGAVGDSIWVSPLVTTDYYITLSDTCGGIPVLDTVTVTVLPGAPISIDYTHDSSIVCGSGPVPVWVEYSGPVDSVVWSTGALTDTIWVNPLVNTTYYVSINDSCGQLLANDSSIVSILAPPAITLTMSNDSSKYCPQDSILVYVTPAGGGGGAFTYSWNPGGSTDSSIYVSPGTTTTYIVDVQDACGTVAQDSVIITVPIFVPLTNIVTTNDVTICPGDVVTLNANVAGGVGTYLLWNNGVGNVVPTNVSPSVTTNYILTAQDSCGAIALDSVLVTINPTSFQINLPDSITLNCLNETVTLDPNITGGIGTETYLWSTTEVTTTIQVTPVTTTTYLVGISDACSTTLDSTKVIVPVFAPIVLTVNNSLNINCPGDPVVLTTNYVGGAQSSLTINWTDGVANFTGNNITVNPTVTTTYTAWVNDTCANDSGATDSFTITVPNYTSLQLVVSNDTTVCVGDQANLVALASGGEGNYSYYWSNGTTSSSMQVTPTFAINYNVTVSDGCGNQLSSSVFVSVTTATANFSYEYTDQNTVQFTDSSYDDIVSNWWTFDDGTITGTNPLYTFANDGEHDVWLAVQDINGCYDTIMKTIRPPLFIYGPNSFSPDGDGINDVFKFKGMGIEHFELMIFDRWGGLLFETGSIEMGWDGTFKGKLLPMGTYVYKVRAESYENRVFETAGSVTLIK